MPASHDSLQSLIEAGEARLEVTRRVRPAGLTFDLENGGTLQVVGDEADVIAMDFGKLIVLAGKILQVIGEMLDDDEGPSSGDDGKDPDGGGNGGGSGSGGGGGKTIIITGGSTTIIM